MNKSIDYLFCIGQKAISTFLSYGITKPVVNIPYSIDNNKYDCSHSVQSEADGLVFLCAGALIYRKGIDIAIKAFKENRAFLNSKLLIIGGGELEFELKNLASDDSRVEFLGFLPHDEIVKYFNKADVFLFPSRYDGWGVVVMEAIASGCVVISSDNVGASLDLINSMENGILCKSESISEFANAINLLQSNIELYHSMKNSSMSLIHKVSSNYRAKQIMEIFNS
ncbi:glycosyltransferase family 4 protein [Flectobacillus sp. BAB-3569]|uniref:glycosyltransferase family 4 protein n=1 Tax=Flectobacillus sp. BAB-3569 TaxID=1509483 RepID=UPI001595CBE2|nr:glycosyltransferase [Flectobacillus sp. BAB-3569]